MIIYSVVRVKYKRRKSQITSDVFILAFSHSLDTMIMKARFLANKYKARYAIYSTEIVNGEEVKRFVIAYSCKGKSRPIIQVH